jgi:hypothetical protein
VAAVLDYLGAASRCDADHAAQSDPSGGLRPVQPPRLLHASRVRQPSFRTMNRLWPSARHSSAGHRSPSPCETPRQRRRTSGAKLVIDISARRSCLLGLDSNQQAIAMAFPIHEHGAPLLLGDCGGHRARSWSTRRDVSSPDHCELSLVGCCPSTRAPIRRTPSGICISITRLFRCLLG